MPNFDFNELVRAARSIREEQERDIGRAYQGCRITWHSHTRIQRQERPRYVWKVEINKNGKALVE